MPAGVRILMVEPLFFLQAFITSLLLVVIFSSIFPYFQHRVFVKSWKFFSILPSELCLCNTLLNRAGTVRGTAQ